MSSSRSSKSKKLIRRAVTIAALVLVGAAGYWYLHGGGVKRTQLPQPIAVSVAAAVRQDVPVYVSGLGTVQALNTVPIHSQIDGQLIEIAFSEGQHVKKGDVLAKINSRLFRAAFDQAIATMAAAVAAPLERQFGQIAGITQMVSASTLSATTIVLQFDLNRNIDGAAQDVQAAITAAARQLPRDLFPPPTYRKVNPADSPILILSVRSDVLPITRVDDYADNILAQQISQVPGVALVTLAGEQKPAVRVQIDPGKLSATGLTLEEVRAELITATTTAAKGTLNGTRKSFTIAANDQIMRPAEYDDVIFAYRNGAPVRVRDVGHAIEGPTDINIASYENMTRDILLVVNKQPGANVIETVDTIKARLPVLTAAIPPSVKIVTVLDRTITIRPSWRSPLRSVSWSMMPSWSSKTFSVTSRTATRDQASRFGITPQVIDETLNDAFGQRQVTQFYTQINTYWVILEVRPELQGLPSTLDRIYVKSPLTGAAVPLSTLVSVDSTKVGPLVVNHQSQFPAVTLSFNLPANVALGEAVAAIEDAARELNKPSSIIATFQGNAQAFQSSLASEPALIVAALLVVYIILGMLYESFIHPLTILSTLPPQVWARCSRFISAGSSCRLSGSSASSS